MKFYIGVEGGVLSSTALACDQLGNVVGAANGGCLAYRWTGSFQQNLLCLLDDLAHQLDIPFRQMNSLTARMTLALSGITTTTDAALVRATASVIGLPIDNLKILEDVEACFPACCVSGGIAVWASSGVNITAKGARGKRVRVDGWGPLLGDEGGGFYIGINSLRSILKKYDGRSQSCRLMTQRILAYLDLYSITEILGWFDQSASTPSFRAQVSGLAEPVVQAAEQDSDEIARLILDKAIFHILESFHVAYKRAMLEDLIPSGIMRVILEGGLFEHSKYYLEQFASQISRSYPDLDIRQAEARPVVGALAHALTGGKSVSESLRDKILHTSERFGVIVCPCNPLGGSE